MSLEAADEGTLGFVAWAVGVSVDCQTVLNLKRKSIMPEFGGAPLLSVNGTTMICHGRSSAKAIKMPFAVRRSGWKPAWTS